MSDMANKREVKKLTQSVRLYLVKTANLPSLIEIVHTEEGLRFFFSNGSLEKYVATEAGITFVPARLRLCPIPDIRVLDYLDEADSGLFDDVEEFIYEHVDLPNQTDYKIQAAYIMHTYIVEKAETTPIIRFCGPKGCGKSRGGDVHSQLARRGILTANLTGPGLYRVNELYNSPTLIIDEIQIHGRNGDKNLKDLLNVRYRRGSQIIRINRDHSGVGAIETFDAYGPTVLMGTEELPDTVNSRSIPFYMEANQREVRRHIDKERACNLRNRLAAFRFRHFNTALIEPDRVVSSGRLDEVLLPLHQIIKLVKPQFEADFIVFAKQLESDRKEEDFESFDAEICRALVAGRSKVVSGKIAVDDVTSEVNSMRQYPLSQRTVGSALTRLGLKTCRIAGTGKYARLWDENRIIRLASKFDVHYPTGRTKRSV